MAGVDVAARVREGEHAAAACQRALRRRCAQVSRTHWAARNSIARAGLLALLPARSAPCTQRLALIPTIACSDPHAVSFPFPLLHAHSHSLSHTFPLPFTHSLAPSCTFSRSRPHRFSLSLVHCHPLTCTLSLTHTHISICFLSHSHLHSLPLTAPTQR
eukprot:2767560-Rhodomonas_salina.2